MNRFHPLIGLLILTFIFLAPWLRSYVPRSAENFNFYLVLLLHLFFLFLGLWSVYLFFRPNSSSPWPLWLRELGQAPTRFHEWLGLHLPQPTWWTQLRWNVVQYLSSLEWPYSGLSLLLSFFPLIPPLFLLLEFLCYHQIHLFYFSLLILPLHWSFRLASFHLEEFSSFVQRVQERDFSVTWEQGRYLLTFHQEDPSALNKAANWRVFLTFRRKLSLLQKSILEKALGFLFIRSLVYALAWLQILLAHPHFSLGGKFSSLLF